MSLRSTITMKQKERLGVTGATIAGIHYMFLLIVSMWGSHDSNTHHNLNKSRPWLGGTAPEI